MSASTHETPAADAPPAKRPAQEAGLTLAPDAGHRGGADAAAAGTRLSAIAAARSATLEPLLEIHAVPRHELPADAATVAAVAGWIERPADDELVAQLAAQPARVAAALELANCLQLRPLVAALLDSLGADGSAGLLRTCMEAVPSLPWMLAAKLALDDEKTAALLEAVLACDGAAIGDEKSAALTWVQLQLCDAEHLVHKDACLGLFAWAGAERERRRAGRHRGSGQPGGACTRLSHSGGGHGAGSDAAQANEEA